MLKEYWDKIYSSKDPNQVSWTQSIPTTSMNFIHSFQLSKKANIIDIGGGESKLVDYLLMDGFENITVLDISSCAIEKSKKRLGVLAEKVTWIVSDIIDFNTDKTYDVWHDRATFHFLTKADEIEKYINIASQFVKGYLTIGTFSDGGPDKCSGLNIEQYSEEKLTQTMVNKFKKIKCITENHIIPFSTIQNFLFCSFQRQFRKLNL